MPRVVARSVRLRYRPTSPCLLGRDGCTPRPLCRHRPFLSRPFAMEGAVLQTTRCPPPLLKGFLLATQPLLPRYHRHTPTRLETPDEILDRHIQSPLQLLELLRVILAVQRMLPEFIGRQVTKMLGLLHIPGFSPNVHPPGAVYLHPSPHPIRIFIPHVTPGYCCGLFWGMEANACSAAPTGPGIRTFGWAMDVSHLRGFPPSRTKRNVG